MRNAYLIILIVSSWVISACSSGPSLEHQNDLASLRDQGSYQVIQVASNFDNGVQRDHPYFIVCQGSDCSAVTNKTPLKVISLAKPGNSTLQNNHRKGQTVDGDNTTYLTKHPTLLEQFRVHFGYASEALSETYQKLLKRFVSEYPHHHKTIRITGYTDSDSKPSGKVGNEWLALERATGVKKHLVTLGYPETQILLEAKFLCCYIDSNETEEGRQQNRRAEITLLNLR